MFSEGSEVIAVGDPRLELAKEDEEGPVVFRLQQVPVTWWLPAFPPITSDGGKEIRQVESHWEWYFEHVAGYEWYFEDWSGHAWIDLDKDLRIIDRRANGLKCDPYPMAQTRFHQPIAFLVRFAALHRFEDSDPMGHRFINARDVAASGSVIWLPPTTLGDRETVDLILRERYGLAAGTAPPDWVDAYRLPNEEAPATDIARHEATIREAQEALREAVERAREEASFRALLYESGEDVLARARCAGRTRDLGATVEDPQVKGREDGRLVDPSKRNGMLEIKGRSGQLPLKDVRQLDQWARDALLNEEWESKGLLIANLKNELPPWERDDLYAPNAVRAAETVGMCLMTTTQLYEALRKHQLGQLDLESFWRTVFQTKGISAICRSPPGRSKAVVGSA